MGTSTAMHTRGSELRTPHPPPRPHGRGHRREQNAAARETIHSRAVVEDRFRAELGCLPQCPNSDTCFFRNAICHTPRMVLKPGFNRGRGRVRYDLMIKEQTIAECRTVTSGTALPWG